MVNLLTVFLLIVSGSIHGYLCEDQELENNGNVCRLETTDNLVQCFGANGIQYPKENELVVPELSICTYIRGNSEIQEQCDRSGAFMEIGKSLVRHKRFVFTLAGAVIGGAILGPVGAAVGGIIGFAVDVVVICLLFCGRSKEVQYPPEIYCGHVEQRDPIYAIEGTQKAKVSWTKTTATDHEDGQIDGNVRQETSYVSGDSFSVGRYSIRYSVKDSTNRKDTCSVDFEVKLITCPPAGKPQNGDIECDLGLIYGSICTITCKPGYELDQSDVSAIKCQHVGNGNGYWSTTIPDCKAKPCTEPWPVVQRGSISCRNNSAVFDVTCRVICESGYKVEGDALSSCDTNGTWNEIKAHCKDIEPPEFTSCPTGMQVNIDSANNTAKVSWDFPLGRDNSGETPVIEETHNYSPGQRFLAGTYSVQYNIKDQANNTGISCIFNLQVNTISCEPPNLNFTGAEHMDYTCPDLYRLGAVCSLSCRSGYPLGGETEIMCLNDDGSDPPVLRWQWDSNGLEPFCKVTPCPDLKAPEHGALACSLWEHGNVCQIQCEDEYDVPIIQDGLFVCGESDGLWRPDDYVPDCIPKQNARQMNLPSELYYYTGRCNSSKENLQEIQENFVKALNSSKFYEYCRNVPECQGRFVNVTCGPEGNRRKRNIHVSVVKRQTESQYAYSVEFELIVPYEPGNTPLESFSVQQKLLYDMIDAVENDVNSGHFNLEQSDLQLRSNSLEIGRPQLVCPEGQMPRTQTGSCVGCPTGEYFSTETYDCEICPSGTYQDIPRSTSCKPCPTNSTTTIEGAINRTQCLEYCAPGHFSTSGTVPCQKCPSSSFQPDFYQKSCIPCGKGLRTDGEGSTRAEDCQAYDISVKSGQPIKLVIDRNFSATSILAWLRIRRVDVVHNLLLLKSTKSEFNMTIRNGRSLYLDVDGQRTEFNGAIQEMEWTSFIMTIDATNKTLQLYLDGVEIIPNGTIDIIRPVSLAYGDRLAIDADITIYGFQILDRVISPADIESHKESCVQEMDDAVYATDNLLTSTTAVVVIPSVCDAVNECKSKPCGNHTCINGKNGYKCLCKGGFSGQNCEIPPDYCLDHMCLNDATCVNGQTDYTCVCAYGFKGSVCEMSIVNGQWSDWTSWTSCSKSCGSGISTRSRQCDSPPPDAEGQECQGHSNATRVCNTRNCPECIALPESFGVTLTCNETEFIKRCTIACTPGLFFAASPLKFYECGIVTNYTWNHQTEENPTGRLPVCTEAKPPNNLGVTFDGRYETIVCNTKNKSAVRSGLQPTISKIECVKQGYCNASIANIICEYGGNRRKRSTGEYLTVTIELKSSVKSDGSGYNIEELLQNNTDPSSDLVTFVKQTFSLEASAQELLNDSINFFRVTIDGTNYTIGNGEKSLSFTSTVQCLDGSIPVDAFCAECPIGSYCDGTTVTMCPIGQYQDHKGQSSCNPCPAGYTTPGIGSVLVSECSEWLEPPRHKPDTSPVNVGFVVGVSAGVLAIIAVAVAVFVYKYKGKGQNRVDSSFTEIPCREYGKANKPVFDKSLIM